MRTATATPAVATAIATMPTGETILLWLALSVGFCLLLCGLLGGLEYLMGLYRSRRRRSVGMADEVSSLNANLFNTMYGLHTDSMAARQALIRESFMAAQGERFKRNSTDGFSDTDGQSDNRQYAEAEVIEPDWYE